MSFFAKAPAAGGLISYTPAVVPAGAAAGASGGSVSVTGLTGSVSLSVLTGAIAVSSGGAVTTTGAAPSSSSAGAIAGTVWAKLGATGLTLDINVPVSAIAASLAIQGLRTAGALTTTLASVTPTAMTFQADPNAARVVNIDTSATHQAFIGVGAALTESACYNLMVNLTSAQRTALLTEWLVTNGHSTTRVCLGDSDYSVDTPKVRAGTGTFRTYDDSGATDLSGFSFAKESAYVLPVLQQARSLKPNLVIFASPWSPPAAFKSSGATLTTGTMNESPSNLQAYVAYIVKALQAWATAGVAIDYVSPQNEIGYGNAAGGSNPAEPYPSCQWSQGGAAAFIGALGPAIAAAGLSTKILAGDDSVGSGFVSSALNDSRSAAYVAGGAVHGYNGSLWNFSEMGTSGKPWHMTEICSYSGDPATAAKEYASGILMPALRTGASSVTVWNAFLDPTGQPGINDNLGPMATIAADGSGTVTRHAEYYLLSQIARVVQRGALRVDSTTFAQSTSYTAVGSDVETAAFLNPDGSTALLVWNGSATAQTVYLRDVRGGGLGTSMSVPAGDFQSFTFKNPAAVNVPDKPVIQAAYSGGKLNVSLMGAAPCSNGGAITGYDILVGAASGGETLAASNVTLPAQIAQSAGGTLFVTAKAVNSAGRGAVSAETSVSTSNAGLTLVQEVGLAGDYNSAPSISFANSTASGNTVVAIYSGDQDPPDPAGSTLLFDHYDAGSGAGLYIKAWTIASASLTNGKTLALNSTPYGWQMAVYELAGVGEITEAVHGVGGTSGTTGYWQAGPATAQSSIRLVAATWNSGGFGTPSVQINGGPQATNGIIVDASGQGGNAGSAYYHGGVIMRAPYNVTANDYFNVVTAVNLDYQKLTYVELVITGA